MPITLNHLYTISLENRVQFGDVPLPTLYNEFRQDARCFGLLARSFLVSHFDDLFLINEGTADECVVDQDRMSYRPKAISTGTVHLAPSNQVGQGREEDPDKATKRVLGFNRHAIIDVRSFPEVRVLFINSSDLLCGWLEGQLSFSGNKFDDLVKWCKNKK